MGDYCLAVGLHAGRKDVFKAKLVKSRLVPPEHFVRYVANVDGLTNHLLLPEVRNAWLLSTEIQPSV